MFIVPSVPTFRVWMGLASYCGGEAGDAKCSAYRMSPSMSTGSLTLACLNSKSGLPESSRKLSREPVMKLSRARTFTPRSSSAWHRWEPMKPAAPETTARPPKLVAADPPVGETEVAHGRGVVDVSTVDD